MSTLTDIQHIISPQLDSLNSLIQATLQSPNVILREIVGRYLLTKGKQIRPILVILSAKLLGECNDSTISAAASVELLHNASLIHDDVVDETKIRRGNPTINSVWDNHIAVLVGDFFVSSSLQRALDTKDLRVIKSIAELGRVLSTGELDQIYCARQHTIEEDAYLKNIEQKTASLFMTCVKLGGYTAGGCESEIERIKEFARLLGLCFQIKDDIFDYFEDKRIGKPTGNDLREGKISLPLIHVLKDPSLPRHDEMLTLVMKNELDNEEINQLIEYAKEHGGIEYSYSYMEKLRAKAASIMEHFGDSEPARLLMNLFDYTISRKI